MGSEDQIIDIEINCNGRDREGNPVLNDPVEATLRLKVLRSRKFPVPSAFPEYAADRIRSEIVACPYQFGPHGEYCWASWNREEMINHDGKTRIQCPFASVLPKDAYEVGERLRKRSQVKSI